MLGISRRLLAPAVVILLAPLVLAAQGWQHVGVVQKVDKLPDGAELTSGKTKIRVTVFREGIFRVRVAPNGAFPKDFSWAVVETPAPPAVRVDDTKDEVRLTAGNVVARIRKSPLLIDFLRDTGDVLVADASDKPMGWNGAHVRVWKRMPEEEGYYGLGDKAGPMNRRNRAF